MAESPPLLRVDDISLSFGGVHALTDVSFEVEQGPKGLQASKVMPN